MTEAQWDGVFDTGDPEAWGQALWQAINQAQYEVFGSTFDEWNNLDKDNQRVYVRVGQILQEGTSRAAEPEPDDEDPGRAEM